MKRSDSHALNEAQERIAKAVVHKVIVVQRRWSAWLQCRSERLPNGTKKVIVGLFFIGGICTNAFIIIVAIGGKHINMIPIDAIRIPAVISKELSVSPVISEKEFYKVTAFRIYIDSLRQTVEGKQLSDSILAARPGLLDSIAALEDLYQRNKK